MKKVLLALTLLALAFSPLMVSQADAAPVKHGVTARHHRKLLKKKRAVKHLSKNRSHRHKAAV